MYLTIHIILLLFAFGSSKHILSRIQITNGSEIYQIREKPNNIIEIIKPKSKIPTLREIIYFKIKETPYISHPEKEKPPEKERPDFDDSKRPFTNGPGFQFLDYGPIDNVSSDSDSGSSDSDKGSSESNPDSNESRGSDRDRHENNNNSKESKKNSKEINNDGKESNNDNYESKIDVYKSKIENNSENKADNDKLISGSFDADKNYYDKDKDYEKNGTNNRLDGDESKNIIENNQSANPAAAVNKTEAVIQERNRQFDEVKEKYQEINKKSDNSTKLLRRKRETSYNKFHRSENRKTEPIKASVFAQQNLVKTPVKNGEAPATYGMKLVGDKAFVWNDLTNPRDHHIINITPDTNNEWKTSCLQTSNFNQCKTKPTNAVKCGTKTYDLTNSPCQKNEGTTQVDPENSTENQAQEPTKCHNLIEPQKESLNKEREIPSSPPTDNFNLCKTKPTNADKCASKTNESTNSPPHDDKGTTQVVPESSTNNQTQDTPTKSNNSNEPIKESFNKDDFWKWITKLTAGYIEGLNERVEQLVKKQIAKQVNETENQQNKKEKDEIDSNKNDLIKQNETIANGTTDGSANKTNENNDNRHNTTERSIPGTKNTDNNITSKKEPSKVMNETVSNGSKSNKTTPANPHTISNASNANEVNANVTTENNTSETNNTVKNIAPKKEKSKIVPNGHRSNKTTPAIPNTIYGNAMDSDHVTNIFIFYPNAANNETAKDIEAFLGNQNNNVVVAGTPPNDNKAPDSGPALANKTATPSDPALAKKTAPPADPALANKNAAPADPALANKTAAPADPAAPANPATANKTAAPADTVPDTDTAAKTT